MAARPAALMPHLTKGPAAAGRSTSDRDLLRRFARDKDESAFAMLVQRHSSMVLGVCRRILGNSADADDACQATFLILARKAGSGRWQPSVASWLYATARQVALNARTARSRRTKHEGRATSKSSASPLAEITGEELLTILDDELARLPERYRAPVVLCCVEGLSRDEAAQQLAVPTATLKGQLERGRKRLHDALARRGVALGAALLALLATSPTGASPSRLVQAVRAAVAGKAPPIVAALAEGVAVNGVLKRTTLAAFAVVGTVMLGLGGLSMPSVSADPPNQAASETRKPAEPQPKATAREWTIVGTVLGADGKPITADLFVDWIEGKFEPLGKTKTDGTFQVKVTPRTYGGWLVAKATGHGMEFVDLRKGAPGEVTVKLPKEQPIRGLLIDPQGKPLAGASVTVDSLSSYDNDSLDKHLERWTSEFFAHGIPPGGDRAMWFRSDNPANRESESPLSVVTGPDGKFELTGVGAGQLFGLTIRGAGAALTRVSVMNRTGFDPKPYLEAANESAKLMPERQGRWWHLYGPSLRIIVEPEKVVRGTVTARDTGKPLSGVPVVVYANDRLAYPMPSEAVTDKDGYYEIRGLRKHKGYAVECRTDPGTGYFTGHATVEYTTGFEPITVNLACAKGVVVTGTIKDAVTGLPVTTTRITWEAMPGNPFAKNYPPATREGEIGEDGRFRLVTITGPVLLVARPYKSSAGRVYRRARPDPTNADLSSKVADGFWFKVIETKETDRETNVEIRLEPASRTAVKVVDADGRPVTGTYAAGIEPQDFLNPTHFPDASALDVLDLGPKEERFLAVVDPKRRLVGTRVVKDGDKDAVVTLGAGGVVTGRAVGADGKPITGLTVGVYFARREVGEASEPLNGRPKNRTREGRRETVTDEKGDFRLDALFPGQEFRLLFFKGKKPFGPEYSKSAALTIEKHGNTLKLGDLTVEPRQSDDGE
jgi:RNA polymerase sigma factor (sigma-70 family)